MSLRFHWFLPTNGDGRDIVGGGHVREAELADLNTAVARWSAAATPLITAHLR